MDDFFISSLISRNPAIPMVIFDIPHPARTFNSESRHSFSMNSEFRLSCKANSVCPKKPISHPR